MFGWDQIRVGRWTKVEESGAITFVRAMQLCLQFCLKVRLYHTIVGAWKLFKCQVKVTLFSDARMLYGQFVLMLIDK